MRFLSVALIWLAAASAVLAQGGQRQPNRYLPPSVNPLYSLTTSCAQLQPQPPVCLDFANDPATAQKVTVTRNSIGTAVNSQGVWQQFVANQTRRTDLGILIEDARTNSVRNNTMAGAVASAARTPGTITGASRTASTTAVLLEAATNSLAVGDAVTVSGCSVAAYNGSFAVTAVVANTSFSYVTGSSATDTATGCSYTASTPGTDPTNWFTQASGTAKTLALPGAINGIASLDFTSSGITGSTFAVLWADSTVGAGITAAQGQTWTASWFLGLPAGSLTNVSNIKVGVRFFDSGGVQTEDFQSTAITSLSSNLIRYSVSATAVVATTARTSTYVLITYSSGVVVNYTLRSGWPQLEQVAISTGVASATVNAGGTGFGTSVTGTMTWSGSGCSTNPVLNVTTNGSGVITTVNSITTAGSCSTFPSSSATTWTAGGSLSAGTGASFNLTPQSQAANVAASSPIPTTNAAVTRSADSFINIANMPAYSNQRSYFVQTIPASPVVNTTVVGNTILIETDDGSGTNRDVLYRDNGGGHPNFFSNVGGSANVSFQNAAVWAQNSPGRWAVSLTGGSGASSFNGSAAVTANGTTLAGSAITTTRLGSNNSGSPVNASYIQTVAIWPNYALSSAQVQANSAPPQIALGGGYSSFPLVWNDTQLDLDFANGRCFISYTLMPSGQNCTFTDFVSNTNSTGGYVSDANGNWTLIAANLPRIGSGTGLWSEEQRTNGVRNNSAQGAMAGVIGLGGALPANFAVGGAGGLTQTVSNITTTNGVDTFDLNFNGTDSSGFITIFFENGSVIAATTGQTWGDSVFLARVAGSDPAGASGYFLKIRELTAGGATIVDDLSSLLSLTSSLVRQSFVQTLGGGGTVAFVRPFMSLNYNVGANVNFTLRIGWPQLELGASVSSPIRTTNTAVTRNADVNTLRVSPTYGTSQTVFMSGSRFAPNSYSSQSTGFTASDGSSNNRIIGGAAGSTQTTFGTLTVGGTGSTTSTGVVWTQNTFGKMALMVGPSDQATTFNGAAPTTAAPALTPITGYTQFNLGANQSSAAQWNGYISRLTVMPTTRETNAVSQTITTLPYLMRRDVVPGAANDNRPMFVDVAA
jgi:hypothetical protein